MFFIVFVLAAAVGQIVLPGTRTRDSDHLKLPTDTTAVVEYPLRASEYVLESPKELLRIAAPVRVFVSSFRHVADRCDER